MKSKIKVITVEEMVSLQKRGCLKSLWQSDGTQKRWDVIWSIKIPARIKICIYIYLIVVS